MSSWKRALAMRVGDALNLHIVRKGQAGRLLEEDLLARLLREFQIDCVFDVGANVGQYGTLLRRIGFKGHIISFEPIPAVYETLRATASADRRWIAEAAAVDEREAVVPFNVMAHNLFSSLKTPNHTETALFSVQNDVVETIRVQTYRLDTLFDRYRSEIGFERPFLKINTQGNDLAVARSAGDRLAKFVGIQSELAIKKTYFAQDGYRKAIDFYENAGFALTGFFPNTDGHFPELIETDCIMYNPQFHPRVQP